MELNHLRHFYEVAKSGSFTEAARKLRISQSALSKSVSLLEAAEGVLLLERSKKGVSLTPLGAQVFAKSATIFDTLEEIVNTCRGTQQVCEGLLSLGASDHINNYFLLAKVHRMQELHPRVTPSVFSGAPIEMIELILKREIEFSLLFSKMDVPGINYEPLTPIEMAIVCHPSFVTENSKNMSVAQLRKLLQKRGLIGSIRTQYRTHPSKALIQLMGEEPHIAFESNSQEAQKRLCLQGGGVAYLARFMVQDEIRRGELFEIPADKPDRFHLYLATRKGYPLSLNARTFLEIVRADFSQIAPPDDRK